MRREILAQEEVAEALVKEEEERETQESEKRKVSVLSVSMDAGECWCWATQDSTTGDEGEVDTGRKDTNRKVLMQLQSIFGHLLDGKVQFHVPKGFWRDFR